MNKVLTKKLNAARKALDYIRDGYVIGLGSGTTMYLFAELLAESIKKNGYELYVIPTSVDMELKAKQLGLNVVNLNDYPEPDIAVDGADVVDRDLNLIKGGGGALTREKIVDYSSRDLIIIVDDSKLRDILWSSRIPVEVLPFAWRKTAQLIEEKYNARVELRMCRGGKLGPIITDNNNYIIDVYFQKEPENDPAYIEREINTIIGVVENGIFNSSMISRVIVGNEKGFQVMQAYK